MVILTDKLTGEYQQLVDVTRYVDIATVEDVEAEHASCDDMRSGYEAGFCMDVLYLITAKYSTDRRLQFHGWSYACERHLTKLVLEFALRMEEKHLNVSYDEWCDEQSDIERQLELEARLEMDEHGVPDSLHFNVD